MKSLSQNIPRRGVRFWNPIVIVAFSGSLFLFSRAFLAYGPHNDLLNTLKSHETGYSDSIINLSSATNPGVPRKVLLPIWNSIKNGTSDISQVFLESASVGEESSQPSSLVPVTGNKILVWDIIQSFSSRLLSNPRAQLGVNHPNQNGITDKNIDNVCDLETMRLFGPRYDPLELEPFFSTMEDSGDKGHIFALKIRLDPKDFSRAGIGKVETCQASSGVKCW